MMKIKLLIASGKMDRKQRQSHRRNLVKVKSVKSMNEFLMFEDLIIY